MISSLENKKAQDITIIPLPDSAIADTFIIATGTSETHVQALADNTVKALKESDTEIITIEGCPANQWVLVDTGDIIVHLFLEETRKLYNLEKLWSHDFDGDDNWPENKLA